MKTFARKERNQVEINACWVEAIKKEHLKETINEHFQLNPKNLVVISEKPTTKKPSGENDEHDTNLQELKTKLGTLTSVPKEKYMLPMTTNQQFGWDLEEFNFKPKWTHQKKQCTETKYANDYVTMTKKSPYSNQLGSGKI